MSKYDVSVRLSGKISDLEVIARVADGFSEPIPYSLLRKGEPAKWNPKRTQPIDVLLIPLAEWERGGIYEGDDREAILAEQRAKLTAGTRMLAQLAPAIAVIASSCEFAELRLSHVFWEDEGSYSIPASLIAAASAAGLSLAISFTVVLDDDAS